MQGLERCDPMAGGMKGSKAVLCRFSCGVLD